MGRRCFPEVVPIDVLTAIGMVLTCHSAFYSPGSFVDIRVKSAQTMRDVLIDKLDSNIITPEME